MDKLICEVVWGKAVLCTIVQENMDLYGVVCETVDLYEIVCKRVDLYCDFVGEERFIWDVKCTGLCRKNGL